MQGSAVSSGPASGSQRALYVFEAPVRIWHWVHALSIVVLAGKPAKPAKEFNLRRNQLLLNKKLKIVSAIFLCQSFLSDCLSFQHLYSQ